MTAWDLRVLGRAFGATLIAFVVVWLVTAASDEGLTVGARAGRTLPLAPLCSAVGAALALATTRVQSEVRALEALGRSPAIAARAAAIGAAVPSVLVALTILATTRVDVSPFYPRATQGDAFVWQEGAFVSPTLGVRIASNGEVERLAEPPERDGDTGLPRFARTSASVATGLAGVALALVAAGAAVRTSPSERVARRRRRLRAAAQGITCAVFTLVAFQAAAAHAASAMLAIAPPVVLLAYVMWRRHALGSSFASGASTASPEGGRR